MARKIFLCFIALFPFFIPLTAHDNVRIEIFRGREIAPYIQQIVELCDAIYREPPYLYNVTSRTRIIRKSTKEKK